MSELSEEEAEFVLSKLASAISDKLKELNS